MEKKVTVKIKPNAMCGGHAVVGQHFSQNPGQPFIGKVFVRKINGMLTACLDDDPAMQKRIGGLLTEAGVPAKPEDLGISLNDDGSCAADHSLKITGVDSSGNLYIGEFTTYESKAKPSEEATDIEEFRKEIEDAVAKGVNKRENIELAVKIMITNKFSPAFVRRVMASWLPATTWQGKLEVTPPGTIYVPVQDGSGMNHMNSLCKAILAGVPVLLQGPKSTGKSLLCRNLAFILQIPCGEVSISAQATMGEIYGDKTTDNSAADALTADLAKAALIDRDPDANAEYDRAKARAACVRLVLEDSIVKILITLGGLLVINEFNCMDVNTAVTAFHNLLDRTGTVFIPGAGEIKVSPHFRFAATQNLNYAGTSRLNEATASRFLGEPLNAPKGIKQQLKSALGEELTAVIEANYKGLFANIDKLYNELLKSAQDGVISDAALNIRGIVNALKVMALSAPEPVSESAMLKSALVYGKLEGTKDYEVVLNKITLFFGS